MLKPEFKEKWIAALESGDFHQARGVLKERNTDGYCCLGIACVVAGAKFVFPENGRYFIAVRDGITISFEDTTLSNLLKKEIGLSSEEEKTLYRMNDGLDGNPKRSFLEIANWIRENL